MSEVCGSTLTEYPNGLVSTTRHYKDGSSKTDYIGKDRQAASRAHLTALLEMKSWQPHRAQIEAMLTTPNPTPANGEAE